MKVFNLKKETASFVIYLLRHTNEKTHEFRTRALFSHDIEIIWKFQLVSLLYRLFLPVKVKRLSHNFNICRQQMI